MSLIHRILDTLGVGDDHGTSGGLPAEQAVVDLLTLAMLVDGTTSQAERDRIREHLEARDWPGGSSPFTYADAATARVRAALADDAALEALLASIGERLRSDDERAAALALTRELAGLDGTVDEHESALVEGLRRRFDGA